MEDVGKGPDYELDGQERLRQRAAWKRERMADVVKSVPGLCRALYARVVERKASPRFAIKAKCQECVGYEEIVSRVGGCTVNRCPLWEYRPYQ